MNKYKFVEAKENYKDYSSGRVIYGVPNATNFPVRLASDIFQRCTECLIKKGKSPPYIVYDPLCGAAYTLTVLGFLHREEIKKIFASDSNKEMLDFANKNLSLLNNKGMNKRINELEELFVNYKKISHKEALESAQRLKSKIKNLDVEIFQFNIITEEILPKQVSDLNIVIADVPYGKLVNWDGLKEGSNPVEIFLNKIKNRLNSNAIVALILNKKQEVSFKEYKLIKKFKIGKRKVILLEPIFKGISE